MLQNTTLHYRLWSLLKAWLSAFWPKRNPLSLLRPLLRQFYRSASDSRVEDGLPARDGQAAGSELVERPERPPYRRRALLIGIENYKHPKTYKRLPGAHEDIKLLKGLLKGVLGFQDKEIIEMTDKLDEGSRLYPNRVNMIREMRDLGSSLRKGDLGFFSYAGHAEQLPEFAGAERDGKDEAIVPADSTGERDTLIIDDQLNELLVAPLPAGSTLLVVCDSCHSETILDLPWKYVINNELKVLGLLPDTGLASIQAPTGLPLKIIQAHKNYKGGKGFVLCLSACRDDQEGFEIRDETTGKLHGAMTFLLNCLLRNMIGGNGSSTARMTVPSVRDILVNLRRIYLLKGRRERIQITMSMPLSNPLFSRQDPDTISGWRIDLMRLFTVFKFAFSKFSLAWYHGPIIT